MNKKLMYVFLVVMVLILIVLGVDYHKRKTNSFKTNEPATAVSDNIEDYLNKEPVSEPEEEPEEVVVQVPGRDITLKGSSCGKDCVEYRNISSRMHEDDSETGNNNNTYFIKDNKVLISFNLYTNTIIKYNNKQIFKEDGLVPSYVKIFKYNGYTVIHFELEGAQCEFIESLFIDSDGKVTKIDDLNKDTIGKDKNRPITYYVEYNKNEVIVYKRVCVTYYEDNHIGFKYTYKLENNKFNLKKTTKLYK